MDGESLDTNTITFDLAVFLETFEVRHNVTSETISSGEEHDLTAGELEASSVEGLLGVLDVTGLGSNGDKDLVDVDAGGLDVGLAEGLAHTLLESIGTSAGEHLVDADSVPGVGSDAHVEGVLTGLGGHVLVSSNTGRLK